MPNIGAAQLVVVLVLALLILGPKRLPSAARSVGRGMREFKDAVTGREPAEERPRLHAAPESGADVATPNQRRGEPAET